MIRDGGAPVVSWTDRPVLSDINEMASKIRIMFELGLSYPEICACLASVHGYIVSLRTVKRVLRREQLFRRRNYSDVVEVALFVLKELESSGQLLGYKTMHLKCLQNGYVVKQETVRQLLHILDPVGVASRSRRRLRDRSRFPESRTE
jgi:hypothetical protein